MKCPKCPCDSWRREIGSPGPPHRVELAEAVTARQGPSPASSMARCGRSAGARENDRRCCVEDRQRREIPASAAEGHHQRRQGGWGGRRWCGAGRPTGGATRKIDKCAEERQAALRGRSVGARENRRRRGARDRHDAETDRGATQGLHQRRREGRGGR